MQLIEQLLFLEFPLSLLSLIFFLLFLLFFLLSLNLLVEFFLDFLHRGALSPSIPGFLAGPDCLVFSEGAPEERLSLDLLLDSLVQFLLALLELPDLFSELI